MSQLGIRNVKEKRWVINPVDEEKVKQLQATLKIHPTLCRLLIQRGIDTFDFARKFFRPSLDQLHDPFLMHDMDKAINRIQTAISREEKILVYGDYDVDGTTSVALVYSFLREFYKEHIDYYIPDRYKEGYGISMQGIDYAHENGITLIIALDCGIKAIDQVAYANEKGIDFIICDHHLPGDVLPDAHAVLDPKKPNCEYPYKELSGCGIGFKLIQAFAMNNDLPWDLVEKHIDLATVSIASDIVPITGENRVLAYFGLQKINSEPQNGIKRLMESNKVDKQMTISDLVFIIGPRINAAGRMDSARGAVDLLISDNHAEANSHAGSLNEKNAERKQVDKDITAEALKIIEEDEVLQNRKTTVLFQPHWHKGVIGIVASRLIETYYRPTIILTESNGKATGSARSVKGYSVYDAINACSDLLEQFGGHKYAAGLTLKKENVPAFIEKFEQVVSETIDEDLLVPEINIDAELDLADVTPEFYNVINQMAPFGPGNIRPVFRATNVRDKGGSRIVGEDHLKLNVTQDGGRGCKGIAFGFGYMADQILRQEGEIKYFDLCFNLVENEWRGVKSVELSVRDIKMAE